LKKPSWPASPNLHFHQLLGMPGSVQAGPAPDSMPGNSI
jgi:hypothetical protein